MDLDTEGRQLGKDEVVDINPIIYSHGSKSSNIS